MRISVYWGGIKQSFVCFVPCTLCMRQAVDILCRHTLRVNENIARKCACISARLVVKDMSGVSLFPEPPGGVCVGFAQAECGG